MTFSDGEQQAVSASRTAATRTGTVFYGVGLFTLLRLSSRTRGSRTNTSLDSWLQRRSHDAAEHTDLLKTLKAYMRCGGSVQDAADMLGIHRNTVNNKIRFIKEHLESGSTTRG